MKRLVHYLVFAISATPYILMIWYPEIFERGLRFVLANLEEMVVVPLFTIAYGLLYTYKVTPEPFKRTFVLVFSFISLAALAYLYQNLTLRNLATITVLPVIYILWAYMFAAMMTQKSHPKNKRGNGDAT